MRMCVACFFWGKRGAFGGLPNDDGIGVVVFIDVVGMEGGFYYRARGLLVAILLGNLRSSCGDVSPIWASYDGMHARTLALD